MASEWKVRVDDELDQRAKARAEEQGRTLSGHIRYLVEQDLKGAHRPGFAYIQKPKLSDFVDLAAAAKMSQAEINAAFAAADAKDRKKGE